MESEETWRKLSLDLAWAAGLFDGEGCTSARPYKNRPGSVRIQASVSQSSHSAELVPSVLQRFQRAVGGMGSIGAPFLDKRSGTFTHQWRACNFEETQAVIALLWSNLSPIKRAQGADALDRFRVQYDAIRPRYRTPVRPRRFSLLAPGPAASREEQAFAWAAGLFDGEGSTELYKRRTPGHTWFALRSRVSQCDGQGVPAVLQRFRTVVGCGRIDGPTSGEGYENAYKWDAGADDTLKVLPKLWPWLGTVKRVQAIETIESVDALPVLRRHPWRDEARRFAQLYTETSGISLAL